MIYICRNYQGADATAAICIAVFTIGTMWPMSTYTGETYLTSMSDFNNIELFYIPTDSSVTKINWVLFVSRKGAQFQMLAN